MEALHASAIVSRSKNSWDISNLQAALYSIPTFLTEWIIHDVAIQSDRRGNAHTSGHTTANFLSQASSRVYEIRRPMTCFCTTANFLSNLIIETLQVGHLGRHLAAKLTTDRSDRRERIKKTDRTDISRTLVKGNFRNSCDVFFALCGHYFFPSDILFMQASKAGDNIRCSIQ